MKVRVTINSRGTITIPARFRERFGLKSDDELIIEETAAGLLLRPAVSVPVELYTDERIAEFTQDESALGQVLPSQ